MFGRTGLLAEHLQGRFVGDGFVPLRGRGELGPLCPGIFVRQRQGEELVSEEADEEEFLVRVEDGDVAAPDSGKDILERVQRCRVSVHQAGQERD